MFQNIKSFSENDCQVSGRQFIGIEKGLKYFQIAKERIFEKKE